MSWFKHFVRGAENLFHKMNGAPPIGASNAAPTASAGPTDTPPPMGGAATSNAGDAVVNYQTKGSPGLKNPGQPGLTGR
jgi:hypothetical protein